MSTYRTSVMAVWVMVCACGLSADSTTGTNDAPGFVGEIMGDDVHVRSGPSTNYYPVTKLNAGARVTVVGEESGWLGILPPKGCYSVIDATYVDRDGENGGVVNGNRVNVRAGSNLGPKKYAIQLQLDKGAEVRVVGETEDGFLKIVPPGGARLWVKSDYVERVPDPLLKMEAETLKTPTVDAAAPAASRDKPSTQPVADFTPAAPVDLSKTPAEREAEVKQLREQLKQIEIVLREEMAKPMFARDFAGLLERYRPLVEQKTDDYSRAYAQVRVTQLTGLTDTIAAVGRLREIKSGIGDDRRRFASERANIRTVPPRIEGGFDAQGEFRESAIYNSPVGPRRYRLIDPTVDVPRTVCYVEIPRDSDIDVTKYLGRLVGIRAQKKYLKTDGVDPVPIVLAGEVVLLERSETMVDAGAPREDTTKASAEP